MLEILSSAFDRFKYKYKTMNNTKDALTIIKNDPYDFDILLTDINFKNDEMDGISLVSKVKMINKKIICIVMTGYKVIDYNIYFRERLYEYL